MIGSWILYSETALRKGKENDAEWNISYAVYKGGLEEADDKREPEGRE